MPALHSMGAFDYSAGASAAPSRTEINRYGSRSGPYVRELGASGTAGSCFDQVVAKPSYRQH